MRRRRSKIVDMPTALDTYFASIVRAAEVAADSELVGGTVIAPEADRVGSRSATSYPTPVGTIVWCDPALVDTLASVLAAVTGAAIDSEEFVRLATSAGATLSGFGNNRVLVGDLVAPPVSVQVAGVSVRRLDNADPTARAALAELGSSVSSEDRDDADFDLDDLDPFIVGLFDGERLVAYGSGRESEIDDRFDDIAVLVHAGHRRRGLGALAVGEFIRHRLSTDADRRMLYRCTTDNAGSNGIAETLGFTLAHTIGAVLFGETHNWN